MKQFAMISQASQNLCKNLRRDAAEMAKYDPTLILGGSVNIGEILNATR